MSLSFISRLKKIITQFYKPTTFIPAKLKKRNLAIVYAYLWNNETSYGKHNYNVLFGIVFLRRNATLYRLRFLSVRVVRQYVHAAVCKSETISRVVLIGEHVSLLFCLFVSFRNLCYLAVLDCILRGQSNTSGL